MRRAREAQGISTRELASITRIAPRLMAALEQDHYDDFPAELFVRGFLKNCARELALDPDDLMAVYERHTGRRSRPALADEIRENDAEIGALFDGPRWPRASYLVAILAIVLGLGLSLLIFGDSEPEQLTDHNPSYQQIDR